LTFCQRFPRFSLHPRFHRKIRSFPSPFPPVSEKKTDADPAKTHYYFERGHLLALRCSGELRSSASLPPLPRFPLRFPRPKTPSICSLFLSEWPCYASALIPVTPCPSTRNQPSPYTCIAPQDETTSFVLFQSPTRLPFCS